MSTMIENAADEFARHGMAEDSLTPEELENLEVQDLIVGEARPYSDSPAGRGRGWQISTDEGTGFGMTFPPDSQLEPPQKGDRIRLWTVQWSMITGIGLRGTLVRFHTNAEHYARRDAEQKAKEEAEKDAWLAGGRTEFMERVTKLPEDFRRRIEKYLVKDEDWGWKHGTYELFVCEEAVVMVDGARAAVEKDGPEMARARAFWQKKLDEKAVEEEPPTPELIFLTWWQALGSEEFDYDTDRMANLIPYARDQHSGNTFGMAYRLACIYLAPGPKSESGGAGVFRLHGALAAAVGSDALGDPDSEEEMDDRWRKVVGEDGPALPAREEAEA